MEEVQDVKISKREKIALHLILFALSFIVRTKYSHLTEKPLNTIREMLAE